MILHTTEVLPLANYRLFLRFNSGLSGEVNLADELDGEVFGPLRDPALFATACQHPAHRWGHIDGVRSCIATFDPMVLHKQLIF